MDPACSLDNRNEPSAPTSTKNGPMTQTDFTGRSLGGYRILRKLGQGGMAVVYKAHEESLSRVVALKVIAQHLSENPQFITRFQREAQAAAQLSHPNIVQIYAIGEDDGVHYFSMEYVKGRSLGEIIEDEGFLTAGRALPIIEQAAEALAVAHEAGIVHRDIKPANIMLDGAGRVKVADFGIAQMATETRMTQSGMLVGTPEYISPEQCRNEKLDGRSDIYALGVTLYQLLSGRTPFNADTPHALVMQIVEGPIPRVGELNPTIPADVQNVVAKMMHTDRTQRFQSAEDLIHALKEADTQPATGTHPAPVVGADAGAKAAPTVAMGDSVEEPTVAMTPGEAATPPPAATTEAVDGLMQAPLQATEAVEQATNAIPEQQEVDASHPSPATDAYAHPGSNRGTIFGIAALVLVALGLAFVAWQLMGRLGADEAVDPEAAARQAALPTPQTKTADGGDADTPGDDAATSDVRTNDAGNDPGTGNDAAAAAAAPAAGSELPATQPAQGNAAGAVKIPPDQTPATPTTTVQGDDPTAQPPPPEKSQPEIEEPPFVAPPINSIVAVTSGEYEYVDLVNTWFESAFGDQQFEVVDFQSSPYETLPEAARFHVVTTATLVGTQQLEYFGNQQTQYTVALTARVTDLSTGVTVVGPENTTLRYTSINMEQNLERGATDLARSIAQELRRLIRAP